MKPICDEVRGIIIYKAVVLELTYREIRDELRLRDGIGVSISTISEFVQEYVATGSYTRTPAAASTRYDALLEAPDTVAFIRDLLALNSTLFLDEIQLELAAVLGLAASTATICRAILRMGLTRKKIELVACQRRREEASIYCRPRNNRRYIAGIAVL